MKRYLSIFLYRRDLRIQDNNGLFKAFQFNKTLRPIFIFDTNILDDLHEKKDRRISFIQEELKELRAAYNRLGSDLWVYHGNPEEIFDKMLRIHPIANVFTNEDFEPYGIARDNAIKSICTKYQVQFHSFTDHTIFHPNKILKDDGTPYQVFSAYKRKWLKLFEHTELETYNSAPLFSYLQHCGIGPKEISVEQLGFERTPHHIPDAVLDRNVVRNYHKTRDIPSLNGTSQLGVHLRFGTLSIREVVKFASEHNEVFLSELIWREFFIMLLYHFPHTVTKSFKPKYDFIKWRNNKNEFDAWCNGETGYPIVDAGMQQLNKTGYMHNRVRMITASFLTKHLLIDWRWGEAYFAEKLNDFELASNVGNWQWAAGTGCDAAPYFRVFNPTLQQKKFDPDGHYVKKWNQNQHLQPIVDHKFAVDRCLKAYKSALNS